MDFLRWKNIDKVALGLLAVLTLALYSPMFDAAFKSMDDMFLIVQNQDIRDMSQIPDLLQRPLFHEKVYYRPLVALSYMLEYQIFGLNPLPFHLDNIIIHIATALILWLVLNRLLLDRALSYAAALLFAIHPIQWEAVSNISGRAILLCALFLMLSFYFYCRPQKGFGAYLFSLIFFGLALMAKESAIVFPFILWGYHLFIKGTRLSAFKFWLPAVLPYFLVLGIYLLLRIQMDIVQVFYWQNAREAFLAFLTFLRSTITYLRLFLFPAGLIYDRSMPIFPGFLNWELWFTLLSFCLAGLWLYRFRRRLSKEAVFLLWWFWIFLIPVAQIFFALIVRPGYILIAEHFVYLSAIGVFVIMAILAKALHGCRQRSNFVSREVFWIFIAGMYVFFGLMTLQQNFYSSNEVALYEESLKRNPWNQRLRHVLTSVYYKTGKLAQAEYHLRQILVYDPLDQRARINLGKVLCAQGKFQEGVNEFKRIDNPGYFGRVLNWHLASAYESLGQWQEAALYYERMIIPALQDDENIIAARRLAEIYEKLQDKEKAARYNGIVKEGLR